MSMIRNDRTVSRRLLFAGLANHGHIYPLIPLALACRDHGLDVSFATGTNFHPLLGSLGFQIHPVGAGIDWGWQEALRRNPQLMPSEESRVAPLAAEILVDRVVADLLPVLAELRPDLVVHEPYCPGAALAAKLMGIPTAAYIQGRGLPKQQREAIGQHLAEVWRGYGAEQPLPDWREEAFLDSWPGSLQAQPPVVELPRRHSIRPVAWSDPAGNLPPWVNAPRSRPFVYLTLSTVFELDGTALRAALRGLGALDVDVLAVVGSRADLSSLEPLPARVRVERFVPQSAVIPHADLVVSHGGSGTFLAALAAGRPQLIMPYGADQFNNADDLDRVGAGIRLMPAEATPEVVADTVTQLLIEESYRASAMKISQEIAGMPAPAELVPVLHELCDPVAGRAPAPPPGR